MISEFVEIILKVYKAINDNYTPEKIIEVISSRDNYDKKVVAAAYSWIYDKILKDTLSNKSTKENTYGKRYASEYELQIIGTDNFNYLKHFYNIGIINNADMELILSNLIAIPSGNINKGTIDTLIFSLFLDIDNYVLPGSRLLLFSSDKIN